MLDSDDGQITPPSRAGKRRNSMKVTVTTDIEVEGKYCAASCRHLRGARPAECALWPRMLNRCLGGGPLRCSECLAVKQAPPGKYFIFCPLCGKPFIFFHEIPQVFDPIDCSKMILPDGSRPSAGEIIFCQNCKSRLGHEDLDLKIITEVKP